MAIRTGSKGKQQQHGVHSKEPAAGALFVRFEYDDHQHAADDAEAEFYNNFRRDAYKESDIDTVRKIRELAMEGQLDAPLQ